MFPVTSLGNNDHFLVHLCHFYRPGPLLLSRFKSLGHIKNDDSKPPSVLSSSPAATQPSAEVELSASLSAYAHSLISAQQPGNHPPPSHKQTLPKPQCQMQDTFRSRLLKPFGSFSAAGSFSVIRLLPWLPATKCCSLLRLLDTIPVLN